MAVTVRNVPYELLLEILGKLPKKDLKNARLTCTLWSTVGAKWMFQRVYFAPRKATMKCFASIAANPVFARNVKELIYDGRLFLPELKDPTSYWEAFHARMWEERDGYEDVTRNYIDRGELEFADGAYYDSIWNMESLGAALKKRLIAGDPKKLKTNVANSLARYTRLLEQQEKYLTKGRDFKILREGLKASRNITKVGIFVDFQHCSDYFDWKGDENYPYIECHDWYSSKSKFEFGCIVPPSKWCRRSKNLDGWQMDQEEAVKWDVRGVQTLVRALSTHCPSLKELHIASQDYKAPMTMFQLSEADTEKFCSMAHRLTTLQLHPYVTKSDCASEYAKQQHCLELFFQAAKNLRTLSSSRWCLNYEEEFEDSDEDDDDENKDLVLSELTDFRLFVGKPWSHLTKLTLRAAQVKASDLMSFLQDYSESLRDLTLYDISLLGNEQWEQLGKEMARFSSCILSRYLH